MAYLHRFLAFAHGRIIGNYKKKSCCHNLFPLKCPNQTLSEYKAMLCLAVIITGRSSGFHYERSGSNIHPGDQLSWLMFASVPPAQHSDIISNYTTALSYTIWPLLNSHEQCLYLQHTHSSRVRMPRNSEKRSIKQDGHDSGLNHTLFKISILYLHLSQGSDPCSKFRWVESLNETT